MAEIFDDSKTSINQLKQLVNAFIAERDWHRFHTPKNIAVSVVLEASELLEHFQWSPPAEDAIDAEKKLQIGEELADVMAYLLSLANVLEIDVSSAMAAKMQKNRRKYPAGEFNGIWKKAES